MKIRILITMLLVAVTATAQDFYGKATYKTYQKMNIQMDSTNANSAMQKQLQARLRKMMQRTYTLNFNKSESVYKQEAQLNSPQPQMNGGGVVMMVGGANGVTYKNISEKRITEKADLFGKGFLIKDKLEKTGWKLTGETKNIGNYTCYKAVYEREVESFNMSFSSEKGDKETRNKEKITTVAWYTPEIPVSHGPDDYWGLPGLILEINDGRTTIACTEIVINPKEKEEIKEPTKGKQVTLAEFRKISREKTKEMMNRYRTRRGDGNGRRMEIRIGG